MKTFALNSSSSIIFKNFNLGALCSFLMMAFLLSFGPPASAQYTVRSQPNMRYHIEVKTANANHSGTDNDVRIEIFGDKGSTGAFSIRGRKSKGGTDKFTVVKKDVGKVNKITVDVSYRLHDKWRCDYITVTKNASSKITDSEDGYYRFNVNYYFGKTARSFTPSTVKHPVVDSRPVPTTQIRYLGETDRGNDVLSYNYERQTKSTTLPKVEADKSQRPRIALTLESSVGAYKDQRYVNIGTQGSVVAASSTGNLIYDDLVQRGYYLEEANVEIRCLTSGFSLPSHGPLTSEEEGSVSSSSGVNLQTGASLMGGMSGADPFVKAQGSINAGFNFGMTYSSNLQAFKVVDNTDPGSGTIKTKYKLSSTNASETWSNPKGGSAPYTKVMDLIRMDAAGQLGGTPLNYLPALAKSNLPLASMGTFKAPNNYSGKAVFEVKVHLKLQYLKKDNDFFVVHGEAIPVHYTVTERFEIDLSPTSSLLENEAIRAGNDPAVYVIRDGVRRHIPDPTTLFALGFNWGAIKRISVEEMARITKGSKIPSRKDGNLYKGSGNAIYIMKDGKRCWARTAAVFNHQWGKVKAISDEDLNEIPEGTPLQ